MPNNLANFVFKIPNSHIELSFHAYKNNNWKITFFNAENNKQKLLERSFNPEQTKALTNLLIASCASHENTLYGKTAIDTITALKIEIQKIKKEYVVKTHPHI